MNGRGTAVNTPNRFERLHREPLELEVEYEDDRPPFKTVFYDDASRSILARNDSPDIPFTYSVNPYRGCEHGCIYCYARPYHEYLGFSAGLDFESKIMVKRDAPALLDDALSSAHWNCQMVSLSGNTDCYQPVERVLRLTRGCLEAFLNHRNPVGGITKNTLVTRDSVLLGSMARHGIVRVILSMITLDPALTRVMEPRTATPAKRLLAMRQLAKAGIPVGINVAPVIPGLTDEEIPAILTAAWEHGASFASWSPVRLPGAVEPLFVRWITQTLPDRSEKVLNRIRSIHGGTLNDSRFGMRMRGNGTIAEMIDDLFSLHARKLGLDGGAPELSTANFRRMAKGQMDLFEH